MNPADRRKAHTAPSHAVPLALFGLDTYAAIGSAPNLMTGFV